MKLSRAIRDLRLSRRLSLSELARRSKGLSKGHLHSVENEKYSPSVLTLIRISEGLNVKTRRLLTLTSLELLFEDDFLRQVRPLIGNLNASQRALLIQTLRAAPKVSGSSGPE
jgi:transcriptional regulator with XRE-family HTH domain